VEEAYIIFRGIVQGVGFRFTTSCIATSLELKGVVSNLKDGSVKLVVQGNRSQINMLVDQLNSQEGPGSIKELEVEFHPITRYYKDFNIIG
jgi:acylphosphatase